MFAAKNKNNNQPVPGVKDQVLTMERVFLHRKTRHSTNTLQCQTWQGTKSVLHTKTLYLALYSTAEYTLPGTWYQAAKFAVPKFGTESSAAVSSTTRYQVLYQYLVPMEF